VNKVSKWDRTDPDGVLIMRPDGDGHDAVLYTRPPSSAGSEEFFWDLMAGRPRELADKAAELGVQTAAMAEAEDALARCAPARTGRCAASTGGSMCQLCPGAPIAALPVTVSWPR
jgi:hypothetical protein